MAGHLSRSLGLSAEELKSLPSATKVHLGSYPTYDDMPLPAPISQSERKGLEEYRDFRKGIQLYTPFYSTPMTIDTGDGMRFDNQSGTFSNLQASKDIRLLARAKWYLN